MAPLLVSASVILGTLLTGDLVRNLLVNPKLRDDSLIKKILLDSILALELCASSFEIGVIFQHYGMVAWTFCVFFSTFYQLSRWRGLAMPSTNTHLLDCLLGQKSLIEGLIRNVVLVSVGLLAHRYITTIWNLELSLFHKGRSMETSSGICVSPWEGVPVLHSFASEFVGTCFLGVVIQLILENPTLANNDPKYSIVIISTIVTVAVHAALPISGGLFNPVLALALFGGCLGHTSMEHFFIYWVGSTLGALFGMYFYPTLKKKMYPKTVKDKSS